MTLKVQDIRRELKRLMRILESDSIFIEPGDDAMQPSVRLKPGGGLLSSPTGLETTGAQGDRRKDTATSRTSVEIIAVDPKLADIALEADRGYDLDGMLPFTAASGVPDAKFGLSIPSGAVMDIGFWWMKAGGLFGSGRLTTSGAASTRIEVDNVDVTVVWITGTVLLDETAGELDLLWSQATSSVNALTLGRGAYLTARLMGIAGPGGA